VQVECDTLLESSQGELQVCLKSHSNRRSEQRVMISQSFENPNRDSFGIPPWESRDKKPFGCRCRGETQRILYGERWWLPLDPGRGESVSPGLFVACPSIKGAPKSDITNLLVGLIQVQVCN
jgi:hypothetical protein